MPVDYLSSKNKKGIAIPLVLGILLILSLLVSSFYQMVLSEKREEWRRYQKAQASFSMLSGVEYAMKRIRTTKEPWRTYGIEHASFDSSVVFAITAEQEGAFGLLKVKSHTPKDSMLFKIGYLFNSKHALTLLDPNTSVALAGNASISGDIAMHHPRVELSTHYKMRASSSAFFKGNTIGEAFSLWDSIAFYPEKTRAFLNTNRKYGKNNCLFDAKDTLNGDYYCKNIILQGDSYCDKCRLFAEKITIRGRSTLNKAFATAININLEEEALISGDILARDTLNISLENKQEGYATYILQGRKEGPVNYVGHINVSKFKGEALLLYQGDNWDATMPGVCVSLKKTVDLRGLVLVNGNIEIQGAVRGAVVASYFAFQEAGTLWRGYLRNGKITSDTTISFLIPDAFRIGGELSYEFR